jgi:hypothetical protein
MMSWTAVAVGTCKLLEANTKPIGALNALHLMGDEADVACRASTNLRFERSGCAANRRRRGQLRAMNECQVGTANGLLAPLA